MRRALTRTLAAAGTLALVASLSACGGDDDGGGGSGGAADAPADASMEEFCDTFNGLFEQVLAQGGVGDSSAMVGAVKDWAAEIEGVGTPGDMPDDARHGFEVFVEAARDLDENADLAELETLGEDVSESDRADADAFTAWTQDNCPIDVPAPPSPSE